jgi:hypothetical protein
MINIEELKTKQEFESLQPKDKILVKYKNSQMYLLEILRIDDGNIVGKDHNRAIQENFINIDSLVNKYLGNHIECIVKLI